MNLYLKTKDYSVSNEYFELLLDSKYELLKTFPVPKDLDKYYQSEDYISHTDAKNSLFEKIYYLVKQYTLFRKEKLINLYSKQRGNLLDIGAGTGDFLNYATKKKWKTTGAEPNQKAKELALKKGVLMVENTTELAENSFDIITLWHVLEHIPNIDAQLLELKRLCKPNGHIVVAIPNYKSYDAKYYKEFWAGYDAPRHLWHFSKTAIEKLFSEKQIVLQKTYPMWFDSFYVSLLSEKYKNGKMNFFKSFLIGFISNLNGVLKKEFSSHIYVFKNIKN